MEFTFSIIGCDSEVEKNLSKYLKNFPEFHCLFISHKNEEAIDYILQDPPSVVFLDIDNKRGLRNAFELVKELYPYLHELPSFVAISSSKRKAYDVIKNDFIDYLLKPLSLPELRKCLMKFKKQNQTKEPDKLCLKSYSDYQFIEMDEILYLMADNNTTDFFLKQDRKVTAYKTLKHFENLLPKNFLRIHKSYIVNTRQITRINFGKSLIVLRGKSPDIPFSKSFKPQVINLKERFYFSPSFAS
ncbi:LytTR family DNA-binding domain-containing protein [Salegentibacter sp. JZCK2]|uniref:LytR/AlgR family response regulator transcription factor n=1 Tax=Salegentibacter tibetensis TaxID=2873600 RepID=UPI001CCAC237|nr:LytTR family DNA-binding domain-containing protein [Salegentibacter tibetensis]MBZ9731167.1 LytTR family DNA-binding domain-containing protein [Salegentibacter tibetensis]